MKFFNIFKSTIDKQEEELSRFKEDYQSADWTRKFALIYNRPRCDLVDQNLETYKCKYLEEEANATLISICLLLLLATILIYAI